MQAPQSPSVAERAPPSQAEADYNRLFNLSLDLLCVAGLDGYFKRVNPSWTRVLGWTEAELLSCPVEEFMHPEDRSRTLHARSGLAKGVPVRGLENRYLCKDGSHRWLSWQSVVEPGASTVFAVARDVTERRQLDHEHLVLSKLESTGILAGGIAHDFNNLLASLLLNLEMVSLCDVTTIEQEKYLRQARETVFAARSLTQQLITFADGGAPMRRIVDLKNLLRQSLDVALRGSAMRGECALASGLWRAEVDEGQLGQVLCGLILNAREAMTAGGTVRLQADNVVLDTAAASSGAGAAPGEYVRIRIEDNGTGIPADVLIKIFDPYFSTKQRGTQKGMGLGLTICRTVIQKHGGTIAIDSIVGRGTVVTCHLPAVRTPAGDAAPSTVARAVVAARVLVMDDEEVFREIMTQTLRRLGCQVDEAKNGDEAIALYEEARREGRPFAVVFLDLTVRGGMGGSETLKALRASDPSVQAVLMTGHSNDDALRDHLRHGFKSALAKPFSAEALRLLLTDLLYPLESDGAGV